MKPILSLSTVMLLGSMEHAQIAQAQITPAQIAQAQTNTARNNAAQVPMAQRAPGTPGRPPLTTAPNPNANLANDILTYERTQNADALLLAYGQAVTDPTLARAAIAQLLTNYYTLRNQAQTAEQATQAVSEANLRFQVLQSAQNQVLIQQNQQLLAQNAQIIQLLQAQVMTRR